MAHKKVSDVRLDETVAVAGAWGAIIVADDEAALDESLALACQLTHSRYQL